MANSLLPCAVSYTHLDVYKRQAVERGQWEGSEEGWYYYFRSVGPEETTEPLVDRFLIGNENMTENGNEGFSLRVEALDEAWLPSDAENGVEAFRLLENTVAIPEQWI